MDDKFYFPDTADYKDNFHSDPTCSYCDSTQTQSCEPLSDSYDTSEPQEWSFPALRDSDVWEVQGLRPFFQTSPSMYREKLNIDMWQDWEPERKDRCVDALESLLEIMRFRLRMEFDGRVGLRRERKRAQSEVIAAYIEGEIDPRLTPNSLHLEVISQATDQCFDTFLAYIFSCEDLQMTGNSSLRHKAIGILLDGYTVYSKLVTDVAAVVKGKLGAMSREKDWTLKFFQAVNSRQGLKELCERDWSSYAGRAMRRSYRSLQRIA